MQLLHDETKDGFNKLVDALNDPSAAENLPFRPGQELKSATVQSAIEEVYAAAKKAAAGTIPDHAVGKEKLTQELLQRVYGGRLWVSMEEPTAAHSPETDFPVGQLWLRPSFTMTNLAKDQWELLGFLKQPMLGGFTLVSDGSRADAFATQTLSKVGSAGEHVVVHLKVNYRSSKLVMLQLGLNDSFYDLMSGETAFDGVTDENGDLQITISAVWPIAMTDEAVSLIEFAVVNVTRLERAIPGCQTPDDWHLFLKKAVPFTVHTCPMAMYVQTQPGRWETAVYDTLPSERGGTGLSRYTPGQMLYADAKGILRPLEPPSKESFLSYNRNSPVWRDPAQCIQTMGGLRMATGTYQGNGQNGRTVTLPVTPKLLYLQPNKDPIQVGEETVIDNPTVLANGGKVMGRSLAPCTDGGKVIFTVMASLQGNTLRFQWTGTAHEADRTTEIGNRRGVTYTWYAIY